MRRERGCIPCNSDLNPNPNPNRNPIPNTSDCMLNTCRYSPHTLRGLLAIIGDGGTKYTVKGGLELYLSERRAPLGYDSNGRRLYHSQDSIFVAVAAAFMQSSIAVLDASTATPSFVVVRTARIGVRSPHGPLLGAQTTGLQADSGRRALSVHVRRRLMVRAGK